MANTSSPTKSQPPRGSTVWVGLDEFGSQTVARLGRWFAEDGPGLELAAANRLLPRLMLPVAEDAGSAEANGDGPGEGHTPFHAPEPEPEPDITPYDPAGDRIQQAIGELLADRQSRLALAWADRDILVPHVWLVADLGSAEIAGLAAWVAALERRFRALQVEARIFLLLRYRSWGLPGEEQAEIEGRLRALVTEVLDQGTPGQGTANAVIISDRDGIGGLYSDQETTAVVQRFTDLVLLGDIVHTGESGLERAPTRAFSGHDGDWGGLPAFASVAGDALEWDAPALFRENAERRRRRLFAALDEPAPPNYTPDHPELERVSLTDTHWPSLDLPRWSPRFWHPAREEFVRSGEVLDRWLAEAQRWRHTLLVAHEDRRAHVEHQAERVYRTYVRDLDDLTRTTLEDPALPGFFSPLQRVLERAAADLRVRRADLGYRAPAEEPPLDAPGAIREPKVVMAAVEERLVRALERKINPLLLAQVAVATFLLSWIWTVTILRDLPQTLLGSLLRLLGVLPPLPAAARERATALAEWQPASEAQLWFWSGLGLGVPLAAITIFIALRQRIVLERAWKQVHDRAQGWRNTALARVQHDLERTEAALAWRNIDAAEGEAEARQEQLRRLRALAQRDPLPAPEPDPAVGGHILPAKAPPPPLSDLQVSQILAAFRRGRGDDPGLRAAPRDMMQGLFEEAARVAGDIEPDLRLELPALQRRIAAALPPDGAVRVQQLDSARAEHAPPPVVRFLAAPARVAADLRLPRGVTPVSIPVDNRFYAMIVQSGMSARRVLSLPPFVAGDPPEPAATEGVESVNGAPVEQAAAAGTNGPVAGRDRDEPLATAGLGTEFGPSETA